MPSSAAWAKSQSSPAYASSTAAGDGVPRRQPVPDSSDRDAQLADELDAAELVLLGKTGDEAAAVDPEQGARRPGRCPGGR
jgi:hypothetical protein